VYFALAAALLAVAAAGAWLLETSETRPVIPGIDSDGDGLPDSGSIRVTVQPLRLWALPLAFASLAVAVVAAGLAWRAKRARVPEAGSPKRREGD